MQIFSQVKKKLALQLALNTAAVTLIIAAIISTISIHSSIQSLKTRQQQIVSSTISSTLPSFNLATFNYNTRLNQQLAEGLVTHPYIISAVVIDSTGTQLAQAIKATTCQPSTLGLMIFSEPGIHIEALSYNNTPLGKLIIELDHCRSIAELNNQAWNILFNALLFSLLLATFIYAAFYRAVTSPLTRLVKQLTGLTADNLDKVDLTRMQSRRQDELGQLTNQFAALLNLLKDHIHQQRKAEATINDYSIKLEELIHKRTHALTHLNRRLQQSADDNPVTAAPLQARLHTLTHLLQEPLDQLVNTLSDTEQTHATAMATHIRGLLRDLRILQDSNSQRGRELIDISNIATECLQNLPPGYASTDYQPPASGALYLNRESVRLLLHSLLSNAIIHTSSKGHLTLSLWHEQQRLTFSLSGAELFLNEALFEQDLMPLCPENMALPSAFGLGLSRELAQLLGGELRAQQQADGSSLLLCSIHCDSLENLLPKVRKHLHQHPLSIVVENNQCRTRLTRWSEQWQLPLHSDDSSNVHNLLVTDNPETARRHGDRCILLNTRNDPPNGVTTTEVCSESDLLTALLEQAAPQHTETTRSLRVLLVDDNTINRMLCQRYLKNLNIEPDTADNGLQAISHARHTRYDLILMDCQMPVMDGFEATRQIRRNSLNSQTPIIALTGLIGENERQQCLTAGMNDFIGKPFTQDQIQATLVQWINNYYDNASD
ncbi:response regulator [Thalassolituus hydrocarboniclasticus]|uniref:Response regulator n=1 Tax=Thalassolituus hydrocarboniclasticus TaxID=2742796 RepID=A0ABY6AB30_9GAMM|nr:hybrid sensor histidine kinase/response regulator [Thalassolituus hydrocarboniclasticus]UXD87644.1 response regulator [Thalassolituus hydrocarboniclasticus]